jgi:hypothetical protein
MDKRKILKHPHALAPLPDKYVQKRIRKRIKPWGRRGRGEPGEEDGGWGNRRRRCG